ncbi:hypothetical protein LINGRAHAP2_LOCUS525 [Linum grandiflorum]
MHRRTVRAVHASLSRHRLPQRVREQGGISCLPGGEDTKADLS